MKQMENLFIVIVIMNCLNCYDHLRKRIFSHLETRKTSKLSTFTHCGGGSKKNRCLPFSMIDFCWWFHLNWKPYRNYLPLCDSCCYDQRLSAFNLIILSGTSGDGRCSSDYISLYNFHAFILCVCRTNDVYSNWYFSSVFSLISPPASSNCVFPQQWEGSWFQSGVPQTIDIQGSTMSNRGTCIASDGDKFLMREWVKNTFFLAIDSRSFIFIQI